MSGGEARVLTTTDPTDVNLRWGALGLGVAAVIIVLGNVDLSPGENGGPGPAAATAVICLLLAAGLFGLGLRRWTPSRRVTVILAAATVLSLAVFWSGAVGVLAAATMASRPAHRDTMTRVAAGAAIAAAALATTVTVVTFLQ